MYPQEESLVGTTPEQPAAQPEAMDGGLLPAAPPKVETGVGVSPSAPEAAAQTENIKLSPTEMDAAMRQGALDGKAILEPAPADVAANALSGNELLKTPGQPELNATHQQMVTQKNEAAQAPQRLPMHKRFWGALGFGGSKSEAPVAAATPDHLVATAGGTLETPKMPDFGKAGTESASIAAPTGEATQGLSTADQTAAGTPETPASTLGEMSAITPPPAVEAALPVAEVAPPAAVDAPETSLSQDMENAGEHPTNLTVDQGAISTFPTAEPTSAPLMTQDTAAPIVETPTATLTATEETEETTSPDPAGGLDIERSATPLATAGAPEGTANTSADTSVTAGTEGAEDHPDPLAVPQPLSPTAMTGVEGALEKAGAENLGETLTGANATDGLPTADEAIAGAEQIVSNAQTTGEQQATHPMPAGEVEESPTNPSEIPQPAASNSDASLNPQAMADINNALGVSADSLGNAAATAPDGLPAAEEPIAEAEKNVAADAPTNEGLPGVSDAVANDVSEALSAGGADTLSSTPEPSPTISETAEDGLDASAAVAEAGNIVTGQSISNASPSPLPAQGSEDQGNSGAGTPPTPVTA